MNSDGFTWTCCLCQKDPIICAFYPVITPPLPGWIIIRHHTEKWKASVCTHTHTHSYCLCVQLLVELPGRVLSKLEYESRNEGRRTLKPPELLGQCLKWYVRAHRAHELSFGFFFCLCCLKPDDMHAGVMCLLELVVEFEVSILQQGEETL